MVALGDRKQFRLITHVLEGIIQFRFDDPPSICAGESL